MNFVILTDLETAGTDKNAAIFSFATALFDLDDPQSVETIADDFINNRLSSSYLYSKLHVGDQWLQGRVLQASTQAWWADDRRKEPRENVMGGTGSLKEVLLTYVAMINTLIEKTREVHGEAVKIVLYFRDRQFDDNIIQHAAEYFGIKLPYIHNQRRDVRTYIDAKLDTNIGYIPDYNPFSALPRHNAMADVLKDAASMCEAKRRSLVNTRSDYQAEAG